MIKITHKHEDEHRTLVPGCYNDKTMSAKDCIDQCGDIFNSNRELELLVTEFDLDGRSLTVQRINWWQGMRDFGADFDVYSFLASDGLEFKVFQDELKPLLIDHNSRFARALVSQVMATWQPNTPRIPLL